MLVLLSLHYLIGKFIGAKGVVPKVGFLNKQNSVKHTNGLSKLLEAHQGKYLCYLITRKHHRESELYLKQQQC